MQLRRCVSVMSLLLVALLPGCAYMTNRGEDLGDCFQANVGLGLGVYAHVNATDCVSHTAVGAKTAIRAGWDPMTARAAEPRGHLWLVAETAWGLGLRSSEEREAVGPAVGYPHIETQGCCLPLTTWKTYWVPSEGEAAELARSLTGPGQIAVAYGQDDGLGPDRVGETIANMSWLEADVFAGILGARLGFNPLQFLDFLLGWTTLDMLRDDAAQQPW